MRSFLTLGHTDVIEHTGASRAPCGFLIAGFIFCTDSICKQQTNYPSYLTQENPLCQILCIVAWSRFAVQCIRTGNPQWQKIAQTETTRAFFHWQQSLLIYTVCYNKHRFYKHPPGEETTKGCSQIYNINSCHFENPQIQTEVLV